MLGIIVGGALKMVAEEDMGLHRKSNVIMALGLLGLATAILIEKAGYLGTTNLYEKFALRHLIGEMVVCPLLY
jgi:hypothetical protein